MASGWPHMRFKEPGNVPRGITIRPAGKGSKNLAIPDSQDKAGAPISWVLGQYCYQSNVSHEEEVDLRAEKRDGKTILATCTFPGVKSSPCAFTWLETLCCPPLKLTYSCLGNFETSTCLLKQNSEDCASEKFHTADFSRVWLCLKKKIQRAEAN